ncbi:MAG: glycosyltransferase family 39 protein [Thermoguttaceae bacterium]|jgi:4-amino-4-deoxy-L-arabinose transferase-like glycosyltransferase
MKNPREGEPRPRAAALLPLEVFPAGADPLSPQRQAQWIWALLLIGLAARTVRYLLQFPLWEDEAMLAANYLDRGYRQLLDPLTYHQVAPPLFLWAQLTVVKLLGFSECTLRLIPFLCGLGSLCLFRHLAGRLLRGTPLLLAVGMFAVAYPAIRYSAEAKPYGCDLFLALLMWTLLVEWLRRPDTSRWLWVLAALVGPVVGFSYPSVFVAGGISLVVAAVLWRCRDRARCVPAWIVFNLILVAAFLALLALNRSAVGANQEMMEETWQETFPPSLMHPWKLLTWLISTHAGGMLAYPVGGPSLGSSLTLVCWAAGIAILARRQRLLLGILLTPLGLNFLAAYLHRFPYGGHCRFTLFEAPAVCLLAAVGISGGLLWLDKRRAAAVEEPSPSASLSRWLRYCTPLNLVLSGLFMVAGASLLRDLSHPYKSGTTLRAREFARWFWFDLAHDSELVCLETDLKQNLSPGTFQWGWSALYLCNQRIYSPRHARGEPPQLDRVSTDWPLRCVLFRSSTEERDDRPLQQWLATMQTQYLLIARDKYPFPIYDKWEKGPRTVDFIETFKFIPKSPATDAGAMAAKCSALVRR